MFKTFKAIVVNQSKTDITEDGCVFLFPKFQTEIEFETYNLSKERFKFSEEDVIFKKKQKEKFKDYDIKLNPFYGGLFADGVKYKLIREHVKGMTKYYIAIDDNKAMLKLNWFNNGLIEWVHGRKVNLKLLKVIAALIAAIAALISAIILIIGSISSKENNTNQPNTDKIKEISENQREQHIKDSITERYRQDSTKGSSTTTGKNKNLQEDDKHKNDSTINMEIVKQICAAKSYVENKLYNNAIDIYENIRKHLPNGYNSHNFEEIDSYLNIKDIEKASKAYCNLFSKYKCR